MTQSTDVTLPDLQASPLAPLDAPADTETKRTANNLEAVFDVNVNVSAILGKSTMEVSQLLKLA